MKFTWTTILLISVQVLLHDIFRNHSHHQGGGGVVQEVSSYSIVSKTKTIKTKTTTTTTTTHHPLLLPPPELFTRITRRNCIQQMACVTLLVTTQSPYSSYANEVQQQQQSSSPPSKKTIIINSLIEAQTTLNTLIENYQRATIDCTFADVPRDLLESKNKELLLEKASTFALFDKSVSVETCKTTNRIVRSYLGLTGIGPLVGIEKRIRSGLEYIEPDFLDDYVSEFEGFSQALSKATSLSYTSGVADFDSVNNFSKDDVDDENRDSNSNLQQTKEAIKEAKGNLDRIIIILLNSNE